MFRAMILKGVLEEVGRLENATKKRSIRIDTRTTNWPFWDIVGLGKWCLID